MSDDAHTLLLRCLHVSLRHHSQINIECFIRRLNPWVGCWTSFVTAPVLYLDLQSNYRRIPSPLTSGQEAAVWGSVSIWKTYYHSSPLSVRTGYRLKCQYCVFVFVFSWYRHFRTLTTKSDPSVKYQLSPVAHGYASLNLTSPLDSRYISYSHVLIV